MSADANHGKQHEVLTIVEEISLFAGSRTHIVRGRMPVGLVEQAKRKSGNSSDSKLLELALATLTVSDDYAQWLLAQRATVNPVLDLEFWLRPKALSKATESVGAPGKTRIPPEIGASILYL